MRVQIPCVSPGRVLVALGRFLGIWFLLVSLLVSWLIVATEGKVSDFPTASE